MIFFIDKIIMQQKGHVFFKIQMVNVKNGDIVLSKKIFGDLLMTRLLVMRGTNLAKHLSNKAIRKQGKFLIFLIR